MNDNTNLHSSTLRALRHRSARVSLASTSMRLSASGRLDTARRAHSLVAPRADHRQVSINSTPPLLGLDNPAPLRNPQ